MELAENRDLGPPDWFGIWFPWTLLVTTLIFVKTCREVHPSSDKVLKKTLYAIVG